MIYIKLIFYYILIKFNNNINNLAKIIKFLDNLQKIFVNYSIIRKIIFYRLIHKKFFCKLLSFYCNRNVFNFTKKYTVILAFYILYFLVIYKTKFNNSVIIKNIYKVYFKNSLLNY